MRATVLEAGDREVGRSIQVVGDKVEICIFNRRAEMVTDNGVLNPLLAILTMNLEEVSDLIVDLHRGFEEAEKNYQGYESVKN